MSMKFEFAGKYKFEKCKVDPDGNDIVGTREDVTGWFNNVITDAGLDLLGSTVLNGILVQCRVGSGSTTPTETDTNLVAQVATTTTVQATSSSVSGASPYYGYFRKTFRFALGAAAGNLSEVGIFGGVGNTTCISRALILNGLGDPTTITILSDEILDVIYEFRIYAPEIDVSYGPTTISGTDYSGTIRAANVNSATNDWGSQEAYGRWSGTGVYDGLSGVLINNSANWVQPSVVSSQTLGALTGTVTGTAFYNTSITASAYSNGSFYRDHEILFDLNKGNIAGGIGAMFILTSFGAFQMSFTPKLDKDATKRLKLNIRVSWGRYTP